MKSKPSLNEYFDKLNSIAKNSTLKPVPVIVLFGSSDYLIQKATQAIQKYFLTKGHVNCVSIEAKELSAQNFEPLWQQQDLFSTETLFTIRRIESAPKLSSLLQTITDEKKVSNQFLLTSLGQSLNRKLHKECQRLGATFIPCFDPLTHELPQFVARLALKQNLHLEKNAIDFLIQSQVMELVKIDNEINKLAHIFAESKKPLSAAKIKEYLCLDHLEHIFKLEDYIVSRKVSQAQGLVLSLLQKGEQPLAIIGFISLILRKAIKISALIDQKLDDYQICRQIPLPKKALNKYRGYLYHHSAKSIIESLDSCRVWEQSLKSARISPELALSDLIIACA